VRGLDTHLNGTLDIDGRLRAPLTGRARFALDESRIAGRSINGRGTLETSERRLEADSSCAPARPASLHSGASSRNVT